VFGETGITPSDRTRREIRSQGLTLQSFLVDERVVTTLGWRTDKNRSRNSGGATIDSATGLVTYDNLNTWGEFTERQGSTKTKGIVVKPFRGWSRIDRWAESAVGLGSHFADFVRSLNFHYNEADTFQPARAQYNLFGELLPDPQGTGKDYGVSFTLLKGKFVARLNRYENSQSFSRGRRCRHRGYPREPHRLRQRRVQSRGPGHDLGLHPAPRVDRAAAARGSLQVHGTAGRIH